MPEIRRSEYGWSFRKIKYPPLSMWSWGFAIGPWIVIKPKQRGSKGQNVD